MGVFELQHGFSPGIKKPAEAGYEGVIKNLKSDSLGDI
jgi:hypothetical protein